MKTEAIVPACAEDSHPGPPAEPAAAGWLQHSGLPLRWQGQRRFVVLESDFAVGHRFLAARAGWRSDTQRCEQLVFISLALHPPRRDDLARAHAGSPLQALADELVEAWPPLTPNIHLLDFDTGRVRLLLALGEARRLLPQLAAGVDAFVLKESDLAHADRRYFASLARLARPGATVTSRLDAAPVRDGLVAAGFRVESASGTGTGPALPLARYAPPFTPRRSPVREASAAAGNERSAVIVGAGIAGACAAAALARLGWRCTVLDRHAEPALEASGNRAALFHGTAHAADGVHARLHRAAALLAARRYAPLIAAGRVAGSAGGLLRVRPGPVWAGLPPEYVRPGPDGTTALYPAAGWVAPRDLVRALLDDPSISFRANAPVHSIRARDGAWTALDTQGQAIAHASVLVLAGAQGNDTLLRAAGASAWPTRVSRGQLTWFSTPQRLALPITGEGYAVTLPGDDVLCGATVQENDPDPHVREADHAFNLARLHALTGIAPAADVQLHGRVAWRSQTADRLPTVGAVPLATPAGAEAQPDQARRVPRMPGLFVLGGLGSRGLTWGPLAAEVLSAWIDGAPMPLEGDLVDAIDPARWAVRAARAAGRSAGSGRVG
ncbi:MAG TPA: FAD-dependent 5-carboxymethylaminomethyl-2-thiouridine(34) oxidoreductase MnmC [Rubrivivax sp.]